MELVVVRKICIQLQRWLGTGAGVAQGLRVSAHLDTDNKRV